MQTLHHHWETVKNIIWETVSSHVNGVNAAVLIGALYGKMLLLVNISEISKDLAHWIQTGLGIVAVLFLCMYNILKFVRLWKSKKSE